MKAKMLWLPFDRRIAESSYQTDNSCVVLAPPDLFEGLEHEPVRCNSGPANYAEHLIVGGGLPVQESIAELFVPDVPASRREVIADRFAVRKHGDTVQVKLGYDQPVVPGWGKECTLFGCHGRSPMLCSRVG